MTSVEKPFVGEFKQLLEDFIQYKRSLGYKYETERDHFLRFSHYTLNHKVENKCLSKELVLGWTTKKNESVKTWGHRVSNIRQFALYLQNRGNEAYVPIKNCKVRRSEYVPYIFTHQEMGRFFLAVDSIPPNSRSSMHLIFPLLFRLLYCCGLRISEACSIKISDVDFNSGVLSIRGSKFDKDRMVPMSVSLTNMFVTYHSLFNKENQGGDYYFRNKAGTRLKRDHVYKIYRRLLWKVGISHGGRGKGPRLHDFRHTFCVHTLAKQIKEGVDLYTALPILSTYLGHSSVGATQRYVRLTAEVHPELIEKVSKTCAFVIPEVTRDEIY